MDLLMDGLLAAATLFAGGYCWVLARRVNDLKSLDKGLGASIVTLTRQIELARTTLEEARGVANDNKQELAQLIGRAESAAARLRLLLAAAHEPEPARAPLRPEPLVATRPTHEPMPAARVPAPEAARPEPAPPPQASAAPAPAAAPEPAPAAPAEVSAERVAPAPPAPEPLPRPAPEPEPARDAIPEPPVPATRAARPEPAAEPVPDPIPESIPVRSAAPNLVEVPKPRVLAPIESPLRRRTKDGDPAGSEDEIIEALSRLASGAR